MTEGAPAAGGLRRKRVFLFASALLLRLVVLLWLAPHPGALNSSTWDFGHEAACLGESILRGDGLSDPWAKGTGPSSWLTPPYPALLAGLMALFGGVNPAMALSLFLLQSLLGALTCLGIERLGRNLGAPRAGFLGALLFALYPPALWNATTVVWDTTCVAWATVFALALLTSPGAVARSAGALRVGLAWGGLALLNPAPLSLLPAVLGYLWLGEGPRAQRAGRCLAFLGALVLIPAPWMVRNALVLGTPGLRPNFGVELRLGNNPEANGHPVPFKFHPSHVEAELALYRSLGERDYAGDCARRALEWIQAEPASFLGLCARRVQYFWLGDPPWADPRRAGASGARFDPNAWAKFLAFAALGLLGIAGALRWPGPARDRVLLLGSLAGFGLAYYVTHVSERYRFPIDPLLALLAASLLVGLSDRLGRRAPRGLGGPGGPGGVPR
jgi:4-amino-4-deoxy-L-arabinose transferase-like glycosyltransferase